MQAPHTSSFWILQVLVASRGPIRRILRPRIRHRRPRRHPSTHETRHHDKTRDHTHPPPTTPQPAPHTSTTHHQRLNPDKNTRLELGRGTTAPTPTQFGKRLEPGPVSQPAHPGPDEHPHCHRTANHAAPEPPASSPSSANTPGTSRQPAADRQAMPGP